MWGAREIGVRLLVCFVISSFGVGLAVIREMHIVCNVDAHVLASNFVVYSVYAESAAHKPQWNSDQFKKKEKKILNIYLYYMSRGVFFIGPLWICHTVIYIGLRDDEYVLVVIAYIIINESVIIVIN